MKVIVSDLDGTFLEKNGLLPSNASEFTNFMKNKGFIVVFATARPLGNVNEKIIHYVKPNWLICNDGALALNFQNGTPTIVIENNLEDLVAKENSILITNYGLKPLFFMGSVYDFKVFVPNSLSIEYEQHIQLSDPTRIIERYDDVSAILELGSIRSVSLYGNINSKTAQYIRAANTEKANVMYYNETRFSGKMWLDIISLEADKFLVSLNIAQKIGKSKIDVALGNGLNDLSLISNASWSSCPISATEKIKKNVSYVSKENEGEMFLNEVIKQMENQEWLV